jgi:hypothetical protein
MESKTGVTRRTILGKGVVAGMVALGLSALVRPAATRAEADTPPTKDSGGTTCVISCDQNGQNCKRCCYDKYG